MPEEEAQTTVQFPDFKVPSDLNLLSRGAIHDYRKDQIQEVESIKEKLIKDNCPQSILTLQKAILLPEDLEFKPGERKYPTIKGSLMENPFPKKKKKKGKKKKKKSKK